MFELLAALVLFFVHIFEPKKTPKTDGFDEWFSDSSCSESCSGVTITIHR